MPYRIVLQVGEPDSPVRHKLLTNSTY